MQLISGAAWMLTSCQLSKMIFAYSVDIAVFSTLNIDGPGFSETSAKILPDYTASKPRSNLRENTSPHKHFPLAYFHDKKTKKNKQNLWPESASELYRPRDRRLSKKSLPNLLIEGATWSARRIPTAVFSVF
jgi:hypothetical protein